jgi:hypothetical protein
LNKEVNALPPYHSPRASDNQSVTWDAEFAPDSVSTSRALILGAGLDNREAVYDIYVAGGNGMPFDQILFHGFGNGYVVPCAPLRLLERWMTFMPYDVLQLMDVRDHRARQI